MRDFGGKRAPLFQKGQIANPTGKNGSENRHTRDDVGRRFFSELYKAFEMYGPAAMRAAATEDPVGFLKIVASTLPRNINVNATVGVDATEFVQTFRSAVEALGNSPPQQVERRRQKLIDITPTEVIDVKPAE